MIPSIPTDCILGLDLIRLFGMRIKEKEIAFDLWSIEADNKIDIASCGLSQITNEKQREINKLIEELLT